MSTDQALTKHDHDIRLQLQDFQTKLNRKPEDSELDRTPDGKAKTLPISFVEMTLDELYLGQWGTENFKTSVITNEVVGSLELVVVNPITGREQRRIGAASIIIQVDKVPDDVTGHQRNEWALNPSNKKHNALDLGYPKLKAECVKNAAQSLGKIFGRDLNRKKADTFQPHYKTLSDKGFQALLERIEKGDTNALPLAKSNFILDELQLSILDGHSPKQLQNGSV